MDCIYYRYGMVSAKFGWDEEQQVYICKSQSGVGDYCGLGLELKCDNCIHKMKPITILISVDDFPFTVKEENINKED